MLKRIKKEFLKFWGSIQRSCIVGLRRLKSKEIITFLLKGSPKKNVNLLSSGVFLPYRSYETLICVIKKLIEGNLQVKLDIIGSINVDTLYANKIINLIKKEELESYITVHGQVSEENFLSLHENADIFLFINIDQSWGLAVFEAMSYGIPVIVSNSVGATDILVDKQDAIFVKPTNFNEITSEISSLVSNKSDYIKYFKNGIEFADKYSWDNSYSSKVAAIIKSF